MCSYVIYWMWMSVSVSPMFKRATHFHHDVRWFSLYKMYAKVRQFFLSYTYIYRERDWLTSAVPSVQRVQLTQCFFPPFYLPLDPPPLIAYQITAPIFNVCEFFGKIRKKNNLHICHVLFVKTNPIQNVQNDFYEYGTNFVTWTAERRLL